MAKDADAVVELLQVGGMPHEIVLDEGAHHRHLIERQAKHVSHVLNWVHIDGNVAALRHLR